MFILRLISPVLPVMTLVRLNNGQIIKRGHVANFSQEVNCLTKVLPHLKVPIVLVRRIGQENNHKDFFVNRNRLLKCLNFLCLHNLSFKKNGITISQNNLNMLPENGIYQNGTEIDAMDDEFIDGNGPESIEEYLANADQVGDYQSFIQSNPNNSLKIEQIKSSIKWNQINDIPINEYECDGLASLCFPKLFYLGKADPTKKSRYETVTETEGWTHLVKYATKSTFIRIFTILL